ncbi:DECR2 reductase, partial [Polypterus senegalus]
MSRVSESDTALGSRASTDCLCPPAAAMAHLSPFTESPEDVETDDCLPSYSYLYSPDLLRGQVAFITGGGSGIGFRIAEIFMRILWAPRWSQQVADARFDLLSFRHGCDTVIASRNTERLSQAATKLRATTGRHCLPLQLDVRQPQTIETAVDEALREFGRIDVLVNNAAGNFLCPASELSFNAFRTVMEIDTMGTFNTSKVVFEKYLKGESRERRPGPSSTGIMLTRAQAVPPQKLTLCSLLQDHGGAVVNITATLSYRGQALQVHAGAAKAAVDAMTRHLAVEWGPNNVRVNSLAPGIVSGTEGYRRLGGSSAEASGLVHTIPVRRTGTKTDVAHGVLYLASRAAAYVTGACLVVDGGSWLTSGNSVSAMLGIAPPRSANL